MKDLVRVILIAIGLIFSTLAFDEDFAFESVDEVGDEFRNFVTDWNAPRQNFITPVGRIFHLVIPKSSFGKNVSKFEAKLQNGSPLPRWLLFDKTDAIFWGVPLQENLGNLRIYVRNLGINKHIAKNIVINIVPSSVPLSLAKKCSSSEDITILSLNIDKSTEVIKPKQRVVAINDISKFFGIPSSAFTLKPLNEKDDITDNSVMLAGPGNINSRSSNFTSTLEVPVGCDGRIFPQNIALIHQLRQQAKDGTISEVLRLPVTGWRVKVRKSKTGREKRQALDLGSGDYEGDYYDDYEGEPDDYEDEDVEKPITSFQDPKDIHTSTQQIVTTTASTNFENASTHPHRHHHGEVKNEKIGPIWAIVSDNEKNLLPITTPKVPVFLSTTLGVSTASTKLSTSTKTPESSSMKSTSTEANKIDFSDIINTVDGDDYGDPDDYEEEDDGDDLGEIESETIVPIPQNPTTSTTTTTTSTTTTPPITTVDDFSISKGTTTSVATTTVNEIPILATEYTKTDTPMVDMVTNIPVTEFETIPPTTTVMTTTPSTTTSTTTSRTTSTTASTITTTPTTTTMVVTSTTTVTTLPTTTLETTTNTPTISYPPTTMAATTPSTTTAATSEEKELTTPTKLTTLRHVSSTSPPFTTISEDEYETRNFPPYIENRLKRKNVIAGKIFRFVIPLDTFKDSEDNYDLKLEFLDSDENPITTNSWCQFNPHRREIYGLPLDDHVSKWEYIIRATDKDGASIQDRLTILVQQHKLQRAFNHEFSLEIRIEKKEEFKHYIDWSLKTLRALGRIYNTNMSEITVRKVTHNSQPVIFTWTNDSLPTSYCPKPEIEKLYKILTANDRGDPSRDLNIAVAPELRVKKVSYRGLGVCEELNTPIAPPINFPPILRNPVNHINATVGELLIFRVPKDTFYDPEDLDTLSLNLTLLTGDRQAIPSHNWLQFDSKNREFFGIPRKTSRSEYQLICIDSGGLPVIDSLEVVVHPAPKVTYNVEFSMTIETTYDSFINSAITQKKFVEKLTAIFGDRTSNHMHFLPFKQKQHSTIITWYNKTLPTEKCAQDQISKLESMMKNNERGISNRIHAIMEPDFQVSTIKVLPMSNCKVHKPKYHIPKAPEDRIIIDESSQSATSSDEYLLTFIIPAVVILIMTFFAILAACILYRRRRTGKMNVLEEGRQSYGNKGIPVIFQEELDEKPEAGTKAPVILKDEKPPLAPPEYSKSGSLKFNDDEPYHPPPPFFRTQDNGKQSRPKPAPTYRKPPPNYISINR